MSVLEKQIIDLPKGRVGMHVVYDARFLGFYKFKSRSQCFRRLDLAHLHKPTCKPRYVAVKITYKVVREIPGSKAPWNPTSIIDKISTLVYRLDVEQFKEREYSPYSQNDTLKVASQKIQAEITPQSLKDIQKAIHRHLGGNI